MAYAMTRIYSGSAAPEQLAEIALKDLAPKLGAAGGLMRYATMAFSDGRVGSFSAYENESTEKKAQQLAAELVKGHTAFKTLNLDETLEGEVIYTSAGSVPMRGRLYGIIRLYRTGASTSEVREAFEKEAEPIIRSLHGLARYTAVKLTDGRIGVFNSYDTRDNARKSSEAARNARAKAGSLIGRVLPSDPEVREGDVVGVYPT